MPGCRVDLRAASEEDLSRAELTAVAGLPESVVEFVRGRSRDAENVRDSVSQAESGGLPEMLDRCATRDKEACHVPAAVPDGVVEWRPDRAARDPDISARVDQGLRDINVVAAGRPVEWRFGIAGRPFCRGIRVCPLVRRESGRPRGRSGSSRASLSRDAGA